MEAPSHISNHRREICNACPTPCEFQKSQEFRAVAENACPQQKWQPFLTFKRAEPIKGAGDLVAAVAQPIAGAIDKVFKTKVKTCSACAKRREMLNMLVPFGTKPPS